LLEVGGRAGFQNVVSLLFIYVIRYTKLKRKRLQTISLPVVLCGCETSSVTLREEDRLLVFENGVMEIIYTRVEKLTGFRKKKYIQKGCTSRTVLPE
jgi:hypothetical protein